MTVQTFVERELAELRVVVLGVAPGLSRNPLSVLPSSSRGTGSAFPRLPHDQEWLQGALPAPGGGIDRAGRAAGDRWGGGRHPQTLAGLIPGAGV